MSVRYTLLGLIKQRPRHGYELHAAFNAVVGEQNWEVKPAQIYTTLSRLKESGLITEEGIEKEGGPEKHIFAITDKGAEELKKWLLAPVISEHRKGEFFMKLMVCLATGEEDPVKLLFIQRSSLYKELHELNNQRLNLDENSELSKILLIERAIIHTEADLRWLEMIEERLDEVKGQPLPKPEPKPRGRPSKN